MPTIDEIFRRRQVDSFYTPEMVRKDIEESMAAQREELLKSLKEYQDDRQQKMKTIQELFEEVMKKKGCNL